MFPVQDRERPLAAVEFTLITSPWSPVQCTLSKPRKCYSPLHATVQHWISGSHNWGKDPRLHLSIATEAYTGSIPNPCMQENSTCFSTPFLWLKSQCGEREEHTLNGNRASPSPTLMASVPATWDQVPHPVLAVVPQSPVSAVTVVIAAITL